MRLFKKIYPLFITLIIVGGGFYGATKARDILDWWRLRDYVPSQDISALADASGMNKAGKKYFYVHNPALLDKASFRTSCTVGEETIVLGCYITNQRIYLYNVDDERLAGVEEVTAAHEMLHAAYDRLSPSEKDRINALLEEAYDRVTDKRLRENIASYESRDPGVVLNELHSILGTEVRTLPKDLETYYARYFEDRGKVLTLSEAYSTEFAAREDKIKAYDSQLSNINGEIVRYQIELKDENNALQVKKQEINRLKGDPNSYNKAVNAYNANVTSYNNTVEKVKGLVATYNQIVGERNLIAVEERDLVQAIDTREDQL